MISVREAVQRAVGAIQDLLGEAARDPRLEEVEKVGTGNKAEWLITLSVARPGTIGNLNRDYKVIRLSVSNGEFVSMKMREALEPSLLRR